MTTRARVFIVSALILLLLTGALLALASSTESTEPGSGPQEQLKEFVPTERVAADRAVSFPVDI